MSVRIRKLLVCGTRDDKKKYPLYGDLVRKEIAAYCQTLPEGYDLTIIEGCCPNSADAYAEDYHKNLHIFGGETCVGIRHFPANPGNYLKRNREMIDNCDEVLAFWDGYSYGTAHTIATAIRQKKKVIVVELK